MNSINVILIAIIIFIIIIITLYVLANNDIRYSFLPSWEVYRRSNGKLDLPAKHALNRARNRLRWSNDSPEDHLLAATVLTRNLLYQEHDPEQDESGNYTDAAIAESIWRQEMFDEARMHFHNALNTAEFVTDEIIPQGFIIDAALIFALDGANLAITNDPILERMLYNGPDEMLINTAIETKDSLIDSRRNEAAEELITSHVAATDAYVQLAQQETNGDETVHDPGVRACLFAVINRLREENHRQISTDQIVNEIKKYGKELSDNRPKLVDDVLEIIKVVQRGDKIKQPDMSITDEECLHLVWNRIYHPKNSVNRYKLRQAIFDALLDCWIYEFSTRRIACVDGRVSRMLASLVLLDFDKRNWLVKKMEQFRNDIFKISGEIIHKIVEDSIKSSDIQLNQAGLAYTDPSADAPQTAIDKLNDKMKESILSAIDKYVVDLEQEFGIKDAIPERMISSVKKEALAAII